MTTHLFTGTAGVVWMSGADRLDFLERLSTARLKDLPVGQGRATAVLTDIGRVVDMVGCYASGDGAILITSALEAAPALAEHLQSYVMFRDDVRITDASGQVDVIRLLGPDATRVVETATGADLSSLPGSGWLEVGEGETSTWVLRHLPPDRMNGIDVVVPVGAWSEHMIAALIRAGAVKSDRDVYTVARIGAALPAWGAEIDGTSNPLELGLKSIIDFEKGCYIGQEVVARLDTYDKVQRRLVRLRSSMSLVKGEPVQEKRVGEDARNGNRAAGRRKAGTITSVARSGSEWLALAFVPTTLDLAQGRVLVGDGPEIVSVQAIL